MKTKRQILGGRGLQLASFLAGAALPAVLLGSSFAANAIAQGITAATVSPQPDASSPSNAPPTPLGPTPPVTTSAEQPAGSVPNQSAAPQTADQNGQNTALSGMQIFEGSGTFVNPATNKATTDQAGDVTLDFSDADVRDVVRSIFDDILQKSYTIDPKVTGHITLKTGRPIPKDAVLTALETALKLDGAAISQNQDIYSIVPIPDAERSKQIVYGADESKAAGYGIEIVPLQFVSAEEIQRIVGPLVPEGAIVQIDSKRNLIFLAGTAPERAAIGDTIARFDVDYLKGMSFALIQPTHVDAESLANELDKIFDEANSPIAGLVRLVPIPRINSLLAITARPAYLREVHNWVMRLDIAPVTPERKLYYYRLQNARARDIADTLGKIFGTNATGATPTNQAFSYPSLTASHQASSYTPGSQFSPQSPVQPPQNATPILPAPSISGPQQSANGSPQIVTDDGNNALIIRADAADYAAIEDVVKKMDVTPNQVFVEATIVEVTLNDSLKFGVEWHFKNSTQTYTQSPSGSVATHFPGFGFTYMVPNVDIALSALGALTNLTVLSSPKILTLDNNPAVIEVGDQIPIVTQTSVSTTAANAPIVSTVEQRDTGVILSVTPRIGNSGMVFLDIAQEVSASIPTTSSNIDSPTIQQRRIHATVAVNDGATIALGGLMRHSRASGDSGVPYLKDIPLLGGLFSNKSDTRERTELIVFLTPHVIRNLPDAQNATERLKEKMEDLRDAMEGFNENNIPRRPWR